MIELLIVILIIAVLAALSFPIYSGMMERSRGVQAVSQFRDVTAGLQAFIQDNNKPPLPTDARASGTDTTYGVPGGSNQNDFVVAALMPNDVHTQNTYNGIKDVNPRAETYINLPFNADKKNGMGADGILYDPWGKQLMIAVNAPPYLSDTPANGVRDKFLFTNDAAVYSDAAPREQDYVVWTYGKDGIKGSASTNKNGKIPLAGSGDYASFH